MSLSSHVFRLILFFNFLSCSIIDRSNHNWFIVLWNCINSVAVNFFLLGFVGLIFEVLLSECINFKSKSIPKELKSVMETLVNDHSWSINCSNLSSFPEEWLNPFDVDSATLIGFSLDKNDLSESCSNDNTIFNNSFTSITSFKNWCSKI